MNGRLRPTLLERLFEPNAIATLFQPIVELDGRAPQLFAFECLSRGPAGTSVHDAAVLFEYVRLNGATREIDELCMLTALRNAAAVAPHDISINVHASSLGADMSLARAIVEATEASARPSSSLIVEIIEHDRAVNERSFALSVELLRRAGFRIALDDVGLGYSTLRMMVQVNPDLCKIDRYFVDGILHDAKRAAVVESIVRLVERLGGRVVAEGVESEAAASFLRGLGIELLQGYHFARPLSSPEVSAYLAGVESGVLMEA